MASPQIFIFTVYDSSTGAPKTGAAAGMSFDAYKDETGVALTQPTITEIGGGMYSFAPSFSAGHVVGFILNTGGCTPLRVSGWLRPEDYGAYLASPSPQIVVFPVFDPTTGAPKTGAACTFSKYCDEMGTPISAPTITEIGGGLYKFAPTFTANHDACYVISTGGNSPLNLSNFLRAEDFQYAAPATLPAAAPFIAPVSQASSATLGADVYALSDLGLTDAIVGGSQALALRILHRLTTPRGALAVVGDDPTFGWDVRQLVNGKLGPNQIQLAQAQIKAEVEKDEEVLECTAVVNGAGSDVTISLSVATADGPFEFVVDVANLTIEVLDSF